MNLLLFIAGAYDTKEKGQYEQLMEFFRLEKEIDQYQDELLESGKSLFRDLPLAIMIARAKSILRNLNIID